MGDTAAATPNISGNVIAKGYNCYIRVKMKEKDPEKTIAFVTSFQATEEFQVQDAVVIGVLGPVSIDPQGYNCSITCAGFLPAKGVLGNTTAYPGSGEQALSDIAPSREKFMDESGDGTMATKYDTLEFYNKNEATPIATFRGVIFTSNGVSVEGNQYVRHNVQMRAIEWVKGA